MTKYDCWVVRVHKYRYRRTTEKFHYLDHYGLIHSFPVLHLNEFQTSETIEYALRRLPRNEYDVDGIRILRATLTVEDE